MAGRQRPNGQARYLRRTGGAALRSLPVVLWLAVSAGASRTPPAKEGVYKAILDGCAATLTLTRQSATRYAFAIRSVDRPRAGASRTSCDVQGILEIRGARAVWKDSDGVCEGLEFRFHKNRVKIRSIGQAHACSTYCAAAATLEGTYKRL